MFGEHRLRGSHTRQINIFPQPEPVTTGLAPGRNKHKRPEFVGVENPTPSLITWQPAGRLLFERFRLMNDIINRNVYVEANSSVRGLQKWPEGRGYNLVVIGSTQFFLFVLQNTYLV